MLIIFMVSENAFIRVEEPNLQKIREICKKVLTKHYIGLITVTSTSKILKEGLYQEFGNKCKLNI